MTLRWLFLDLNSYFASVEQAENPSLRNKPVAAVPMIADTTCCIAASYQAKAFGVETGTSVRDAKRACPGIVFIETDHRKYTSYHHRIIEAVDSCIPVHKVLSIDEMVCELMGRERNENVARERAGQVKEAIYKRVSPALFCSVGIAPNGYLAKVASDMEKPNGLTVIHLDDIPKMLYPLSIRDFPGIGPNMEQRFIDHRCGTVERLFQLSVEEKTSIWGGVVGEEFWHLIRGVNLQEKPTKRGTIGHSKVLAPKMRNHGDAWSVIVRLLSKAGMRLRDEKFFTSELFMDVRFMDRERESNHWQKRARFTETQDTISLIKEAEKLWAEVPKRKILKVGVTLSKLNHESKHQLSIFEDPKREHLMRALDSVNKKYRRNLLYSASCHEAKDAGRALIAFRRIPKDYE